MDQRFVLGYMFGTFVVGIACFGVVLFLARRRDAEPARAFLLLYAALSVLVFGRFMTAFAATLPAPPGTLRFAFEYLEAFVGRYGVMFALPFFAHRVFGIPGKRRDVIVGVIVLAALALQHLTEFGLNGTRWDDVGDVAEDVVFAAIVAYTVWIGLMRLHDPRRYRPLAGWFLALLLLAVPGAMHDLFFSDRTAWRLYPLWYGMLSVVATVGLVRRRYPIAFGIPSHWTLSARETEVVRLVRRGLSNGEIARHLRISTNTVKTHLRAIFDKSGLRTRIGLIAVLADEEAPIAREDEVEPS